MSFINYKLSDEEKNDLKSRCTIAAKEKKYRIADINNLAYGYLIYIENEDKTGSCFVVNLSEKENGKEADIIPLCSFSAEIKKSIEGCLNRDKKDLLL